MFKVFCRRTNSKTKSVAATFDTYAEAYAESVKRNLRPHSSYFYWVES